MIAQADMVSAMTPQENVHALASGLAITADGVRSKLNVLVLTIFSSQAATV